MLKDKKQQLDSMIDSIMNIESDTVETKKGFEWEDVNAILSLANKINDILNLK